MYVARAIAWKNVRAYFELDFALLGTRESNDVFNREQNAGHGNGTKRARKKQDAKRQAGTTMGTDHNSNVCGVYCNVTRLFDG